MGISSGEAPITSYAVSSGAIARVIPVKGSPFGRTNADTREVVDNLNRLLKGNHGHAGPIWVKWLIDHKSEWSDWKQRYDAIRYKFDSAFGAASRLGDACALISLTGELVHEALELGWDHSDPLGQLWEGIAEGFGEIDVGVRALRDFYELAVGNPGRFCCKGRLPVSENCFGAWDYEDEHWVSLNMIPSVLKQKLTDMGYRYEEVIESWKEKGWLVLDHENRNPRHSLGKTRTRLISVHRTAIVQVIGDSPSLIAIDSPLYSALQQTDSWDPPGRPC